LAAIGLKNYITTNYDSSMTEALAEVHGNSRKPQWACCEWNRWLRDKRNYQNVLKNDDFYEPSEMFPLVYHLHGTADIPQSMVLIEDDYLEFISRSLEAEFVDDVLHGAISSCALLFVGYSLTDWNFRAIFRYITQGLADNNRRRGVTVQLDPTEVQESRRDEARDYLTRRMDAIGLDVYWGTAEAFSRELRTRWDAAKHE
jgi:hypothetical protein